MKTSSNIVRVPIISLIVCRAFTLMAQTDTRASAALASGWYHTFQNSPTSANSSYVVPDFEDKYNLNERIPFGLELLFHRVFSEDSDATRIGFRFMALSVRQQPKRGAQFNNSVEQHSRLYRNIFLAGVLQREIYDVDRVQILIDLAAGVSILSDKTEGIYQGSTEFGFPDTAPGIQLGFAYLFRLFESGKTLNYLRISPRYHFHTGKSFPFSSGFLLDIGIVIQLSAEE